MELRVRSNGEKAKVVIEYDRGEFETLAEKYEELGMKKASTENGLGRGTALDFYKSRENEVLATIQSAVKIPGVQLIDDVNSSVTMNGNTFNIAIFRIVPVDGVVEVPLSSFLTTNDLRKVKKVFGEVLENLAGMVSEDEVHVEFGGSSSRSRR